MYSTGSISAALPDMGVEEFKVIQLLITDPNHQIKSIKKPINQPSDQSVNQSVNQSIRFLTPYALYNQSTNKGLYTINKSISYILDIRYNQS